MSKVNVVFAYLDTSRREKDEGPPKLKATIEKEDSVMVASRTVSIDVARIPLDLRRSVNAREYLAKDPKARLEILENGKPKKRAQVAAGDASRESKGSDED